MVSVGHCWETVQKTKTQGIISDLITCLANQWGKFISHCYIKDVQSAHYKASKTKLAENEVVVQVDLSEKYQIFHHNEIQPTHWSYTQTTCFLSEELMVWKVCVSLLTLVTAHDKYAVHTLTNIKLILSSIWPIVVFLWWISSPI